MVVPFAAATFPVCVRSRQMVNRTPSILGFSARYAVTVLLLVAMHIFLRRQLYYIFLKSVNRRLVDDFTSSHVLTVPFVISPNRLRPQERNRLEMGRFTSEEGECDDGFPIKLCNSFSIPGKPVFRIDSNWTLTFSHFEVINSPSKQIDRTNQRLDRCPSISTSSADYPDEWVFISDQTPELDS